MYQDYCSDFIFNSSRVTLFEQWPTIDGSLWHNVATKDVKTNVRNCMHCTRSTPSSPLLYAFESVMSAWDSDFFTPPFWNRCQCHGNQVSLPWMRHWGVIKRVQSQYHPRFAKKYFAANPIAHTSLTIQHADKRGKERGKEKKKKKREGGKKKERFFYLIMPKRSCCNSCIFTFVFDGWEDFHCTGN